MSNHEFKMFNKVIILKSLRAIMRNKASYISSIFVLGVGVSVLIGLLSVASVFRESFDMYFEESNFGDIFVRVVDMPRSSIYRLAGIEGVLEAQGTWEYHVTAESGTINVHLVGIKYDRFISTIDYIGYSLETYNHIWLERSFLEARNLFIYDTIDLLVSGQYETFYIRGHALGPEHFPNTLIDSFLNTYGFIISRSETVNNISILLEETYSFDSVREVLEIELEPYGIISIIAREHNPHYIGIQSAYSVIYIMPFSVAPIFLVIAVSMIYVALKRLIEMERTEIGTLKAMGFNKANILGGYLLQGFFVALFAFFLALIIGFSIGNLYWGLFIDYYEIELVSFQLDIGVVILGFLISLVAGLLAVIMGAQSAMSIEPAEAMRAVAPASNATGPKLNGFFSKVFLDISGKLSIRSMLRNYKRTIITILGIGTVFSFINVLFAVRNVLPDFFYSSFEEIEVSDATIFLNSVVPKDEATRAISQLNGVILAEPMLVMPVVLHNQGVERPFNITGVYENSILFNIIDNQFNNIILVDYGLVLSNVLVDELGLAVGDIVTITSPHLINNAYVEISQVIETGMGRGAYMSINALSYLFGNENIANVFLINTEADMLSTITAELIERREISSVIDNSVSLELIVSETALNVNIFNIIILVGIAICFSVVYNISIIALGENQREYATLRILGFETTEVSEINTFEYIVLTICSIPLAVISSYFIAPIIGRMFSPTNGILLAEITLFSTLQAFVLSLFAVLFSCFVVQLKIKNFNLVDVLKERG